MKISSRIAQIVEAMSAPAQAKVDRELARRIDRKERATRMRSI